MDTDSIVTDIKLPDYMVGKGLGQLKLEYEILRGYFITSKTYCLIVKNQEKPVIKIRGVINTTMNEITFIRLYYYKNIVKGTKVSAVKNYEKGSVSINIKKDIKINPDVYEKRNTILNHKGLWVDTYPLLIGIPLNLIVRENKFSVILYNANSILLTRECLSLVAWENKLSLILYNTKSPLNSTIWEYKYHLISQYIIMFITILEKYNK